VSNVEILLTRAQVADRIEVGLANVAALRLTGKMPEPDHMIENKPLWKASTIDAWQASRRKWNRNPNGEEV
jgi:aryl carrier-like protein